MYIAFFGLVLSSLFQNLLSYAALLTVFLDHPRLYSLSALFSQQAFFEFLSPNGSHFCMILRLRILGLDIVTPPPSLHTKDVSDISNGIFVPNEKLSVLKIFI